MKQVTIYQDDPMSVEETFQFHEANIIINLDLSRHGKVEHTGLAPLTPKQRVTVYANSEFVFSTEPNGDIAGYFEAPADLIPEGLRAVSEDVIDTLNRLWSNDYYSILNDEDGDDAYYGSLSECISYCLSRGFTYEVKRC